MLPQVADWTAWHTERAEGIGATYDAAKADRVVDFFRLLKHVKGRWGGQPFELLPWQEHEVVRPFYGYLEPESRKRLSGVRRALDKLHKRHVHVMSDGPQGNSQSGARLSLTVSGKDNY